MKFKGWKLLVAITMIVLISEGIGARRLALGSGVILFYPMLYAMILGCLLNLRSLKILICKDLSDIPAFVLLGISLLAARIGTIIGPKLPLLFSLSWALCLQEFGHFLGTVILGTPLAIILGLGREAVGACFSLGREGALAIIAEKYGLDSPEGKGVLSQYFFGTLFGTIYFGLMAGFIDSLDIFSPISLSMASGVGSISMMTSATGALILRHPELKEQIIAVSGMANMLTLVLGLYFSIFISLPLTEALYNFLSGLRRKICGKNS